MYSHSSPEPVMQPKTNKLGMTINFICVLASQLPYVFSEQALNVTWSTTESLGAVGVITTQVGSDNFKKGFLNTKLFIRILQTGDYCHHL